MWRFQIDFKMMNNTTIYAFSELTRCKSGSARWCPHWAVSSHYFSHHPQKLTQLRMTDTTCDGVWSSTLIHSAGLESRSSRSSGMSWSVCRWRSSINNYSKATQAFALLFHRPLITARLSIRIEIHMHTEFACSFFPRNRPHTCESFYTYVVNIVLRSSRKSSTWIEENIFNLAELKSQILKRTWVNANRSSMAAFNLTRGTRPWHDERQFRNTYQAHN